MLKKASPMYRYGELRLARWFGLACPGLAAAFRWKAVDRSLSPSSLGLARFQPVRLPDYQYQYKQKDAMIGVLLFVFVPLRGIEPRLPG